ncbi:MAG: DUF3108 domain-containing protein [Desulfomonilaceae bacterium]
MRTGRVWLIIILFLMRPAPAMLAAAPATISAEPEIRENLEYQVSLGPWSDVARVHLVLKELKPGHYLAEFSGAAQGMWKLLSQWLPELYQTEMRYRDGRLQPMVYREKFQEGGQQVLKEYRFDYDHSQLTLWRQIDGGEKTKEWEIPLTGPVYDLLSLFYNVRLGALGPTPGGATLRVMVLSDPKPKELVFCIGAVTDQGLKVMVNSCSPGAAGEAQYFMFLNPERVPTLAWTRVTLFGKLAGRLVNPGKIKKEGLFPQPRSSSPIPKAPR